MPAVTFTGETHGCYSDAVQMALGDAGPGESLVEMLTGSPFGMSSTRAPIFDASEEEKQHFDKPLFHPYRWTPEWGIETALDLLGWTCTRTGGSRDEVVEVLAGVSDEHPAVAGPFEMGLLPYHPGLGFPMGVDHYLTILGLDGDTVLVHDPRAHPYTTVPLEKMLDAWSSETLSFPVDSYNLRTGLRRTGEVAAAEAIRRLLPIAVDLVNPDESIAAAEAAAKLLDGGLQTPQFFHLADFMVCVGARRRGDSAVLLGRAGYPRIAEILDQQARLIGSMEYPLVAGDHAAAAVPVRELIPTFEPLHAELLKAAAA
jgi:hypothetical protein